MGSDEDYVEELKSELQASDIPNQVFIQNLLQQLNARNDTIKELTFSLRQGIKVPYFPYYTNQENMVYNVVTFISLLKTTDG